LIFKQNIFPSKILFLEMLLFAYEKSLVAENFSQLINGMRNLAHTKSRLACDKCLPAAQ